MWGLPKPAGHPTAGALLPHLSTLTDDVGGLNFYGTVPEVTLAGRYPAHCPMELGLSSSAETQTRLSWSLIPTGRLYHIWGRGVKNAPTPCSMRKETIS